MLTAFSISVVIPVYNAEDYLEETLDSLFRQGIEFSKIQVILVDDGSSDGSAALCEKFRDAHPENVVFVAKENGGVSSARNAGLSRVEAPVVTFLDSDDYWTDGSFGEAVSYLTEKGGASNLVVGKLTLFEGSESRHPLDYRFNREKTASLEKYPTSIQPTIGNCFFRTEVIGDLRFDEDISTSEDTLFIAEYLRPLSKYRLLPQCEYMYRKRNTGDSLSQRISKNKHFQNLTVCDRMIERTRNEDGTVPAYIQATVLYIINWQLFGDISDELTDEEAQSWKSRVMGFINGTETSVICKARWLSNQRRATILRLKLGDDLVANMAINENKVAVVDDMRAYSFAASTSFCVYAIRQKGSNIELSVLTDLTVFKQGFAVFAEDAQGNRIDAKISNLPPKDQRSLTGEVLISGCRVEILLPMGKETSYQFYCVFDSRPDFKIRLTPRYARFGRLSYRLENSYCVIGSAIVSGIPYGIEVARYGKFRHFQKERNLVKEIEAHETWEAEDKELALRLRKEARRLRKQAKKPIWIFADKEWKAGDNAGNLFHYAMTQTDGSYADMWMALNRDSEDYAEIATYGKLVEPGSFEYLALFLAADKVISSRCEEALIMPFGDEFPMVRDMLHYDLVYLTHGTLFGDLSKMLNRSRRNIRLFSASTQMEYDALRGPEYGYGPDEVEVLGMARYDAYAGAPRKRIVAFLPTWRKDISGKIIPGSTEREYVENFGETDYCKFYNALINDERILNAMRTHGYTGEFYVHPAFVLQTKDFKGNDLVKVGDGCADYNRVLGESALLVTDHSGVGFDFGYQRKPVVYCHFDSIFEGGHTYGSESYFSYEDDGFGPVAYDLDASVEAIVRYIEKDCEIEQEYIDRDDRMFGHSGSGSCERIIQAIRQI